MAKQNDNIHKKHRQRMKKEFLENGFEDNVPKHKVLELLLFYCVPRIDTNPIAHKLLSSYGNSISGVLEAPVEELIRFKGITKNNVGLLKMILPIARMYELEKCESTQCFSSVDEIGNYIMKQYYGMQEERFGILCLDAKCKKISFDFISQGDMNTVGVSSRDVIKCALDHKASVIVLAHNHPGGNALPSYADIDITKMLIEAVHHIGVSIFDHIIVSDGDYISLRLSSPHDKMFD